MSSSSSTFRFTPATGFASETGLGVRLLPLSSGVLDRLDGLVPVALLTCLAVLAGLR